MLPGKKFSPADVLPILRRRGWLLIVLPFVCGFLALVVSSLLPNRFVSETLIQIVPQGVPEEYVRSTVTTGIEERLKAISQQIMSRSRLEGLVKELDLYPEERKDKPIAALAEHLHSAIDFKISAPVRTSRGWGPPDSFRLRFSYPDAQVAQRVTTRLADWFIAENSRLRGQQAESTNQFLDSQLTDARRRLVEQEQKVEAFRQKHAGSLPTQMQANLEAIQSAQSQLQSVASSLETERSRKMIVERLYADAQADLRRLSDAPLSVPPTGQNDTLAAASPRQQLETARLQLVQLEMKLTPEHPDVRSAKRRIADLERKVAEAPTPTDAANAPTRPLSPDEAQRRERISSLRAELDGLTRNISFKEQEERRIRSLVADYQGRIERVPGLESEWVSLSRDYDTLQENYKSLLQRSESSKVAANLEHFQVGEQFHVLDPANVPSRPESPQRLLINAGGVIFGLLLGCGLIGLFEFMDSTYRTEADVVTSVALPVLAIVPYLQTEADLRTAKRRRLIAGVAVAGGVAACAVLGVALQLWRYVQ